MGSFLDRFVRFSLRQAIEDQRLTTRIRMFYSLSGRPTVVREFGANLVEAGERIGENRVARLMRRSAIEALRRWKRRPVERRRASRMRDRHECLTMALRRPDKPKALSHHSDQGSQYTSEDFQRLLAPHGNCPAA